VTTNARSVLRMQKIVNVMIVVPKTDCNLQLVTVLMDFMMMPVVLNAKNAIAAVLHVVRNLHAKLVLHLE